MVPSVLLSLNAPECGDWSSGDRSSRSVRRETRARVARTCKALGADRTACEVLDYVTVRESSGDPCAVHTLGPNEYGRGPHGLSVALHLRWWDPKADPIVLHVPEISTLVTIRLWRRAMERYGAYRWWQVNDVFAGRIAAKHYDRHKVARFCYGLRKRGIDCKAEPRLGSVGGVAPYRGQEQFVESL